jgi:ABC-type multidrug transport system ATPase subunit
VEAGELVGLVGENGSGKSVLMQIIVGLLAGDAGTVERPARLGYCPQPPLLWDKLTVDEHLRLFAEAYDLDDTAAAHSREQLLAELSFGKYLDYRVEDLSGGTRQKLNLATRCFTTRGCCCSTSPMPGSTGRPICASGRSPRTAASRAWASSSSAICWQSESG